MSNTADYWTAPAESATNPGRLIMVTGRRNVEKFIDNPRFRFRIEIIWIYDGDANGMPDRTTSETMERVQGVFETEFARDPVAVLTGIYTGDGRRDWVFYTSSANSTKCSPPSPRSPFSSTPKRTPSGRNTAT